PAGAGGDEDHGGPQAEIALEKFAQPRRLDGSLGIESEIDRPRLPIGGGVQIRRFHGRASRRSSKPRPVPPGGSRRGPSQRSRSKKGSDSKQRWVSRPQGSSLSLVPSREAMEAKAAAQS